MIYTQENLETAMALWEAVLAGLSDDVDEPRFRAFVDSNNGMSGARLVVAGWVAECEDDWAKALQMGTALEPFDWEHCPAFVERKLQERAA